MRSGGGQGPTQSVGGVATQTKPAKENEEQEIDPATLPPIESLGADSDYTMFMKRGVPEPLRLAALRRAWMSDPFIRDFRGPAEYALDYTTAEFDLRPTDNVAEMLDRIFPPKAEKPVENPPAEGLPPSATPAPPAPPATARASPPAANAAPPQSLPQIRAEAPEAPPPVTPAEAVPARPRRKHGGALPN